MEIAKGVSLEYKEGKALLALDVKSLAVVPIESFEAKIASGEIDLIKGTDLDKDVVLKVTALLKAELSK